MFNKDPYALLGVCRNSSVHDVRRSYRRLAMKYHPDRTSAGDAERRFKEIQWAYSVLSDNVKRAEYNCASERRYQPNNASPSSSGQNSAGAQAVRDAFAELHAAISHWKVYRFFRFIFAMIGKLFAVVDWTTALVGAAFNIFFFFIMLPFNYLLHFFAGEPFYMERKSANLPEKLYQRFRFLHPTPVRLRRLESELYLGRLLRISLSVCLLVYFSALVAVLVTIVLAIEPSQTFMPLADDGSGPSLTEAGIFYIASLLFPLAVLALRSKLWYIYYSISALSIATLLIVLQYIWN